MTKISQWGERFYKLCAIIASVLVLIIMLLTVADVTGRYLFNFPIQGTIDIASALLVASTLLTLAYIQHKDKHIYVDFIVTRVPPKVRHTMELFALIIFFLIAAIGAWRCAPDMVMSWQTGEATSGIIEIPYAPLRTVVFFSFVLLTLCLLIQLIQFFSAGKSTLKSGQDD